MPAAAPAPDLPPLYEPVHLERCDSALAEAARRAAAGAEEGTLVWTDAQIAARTRRGAPWHSPPGNLHCALVIRPDYPARRAWQLPYVAAVAAGAALADRLAPMTGLRYAWPHRLLLNGLLAGRLDLAAGGGRRRRWLVLGLAVNVAAHPPNPEPERYNSVHASGSPDVGALDLLEGYTRHFLAWINRWAESGFEPVRRAWSLRADGLGAPARIRLASGRVVHGVAREVDDAGRLVVEGPRGGRHRIGVDRYFGVGGG